jgi:glycosyltransferase involved in cell wall biosynthesis
MIEGHDVICISPGYWDSPWITHQQIMKLLSGTNRVLYVEPPLSYLPIRYPERWRKLVDFTGGLRQKEDNLWITTCPPALPFKRAVNAINRVSQQLVLSWTRHASRRLGFSNPLLWLYLPTAVELVGKLGESFVLYHCIDEFTAVGWGRRGLIQKQERRLLESADLVVTCSEQVYRDKEPWCRQIINVPNGVDFDHYHQAREAGTLVPPGVRDNGSPVIGFSGVLDDRLDTDFLKACAEHYPECRFVLVGPARKAFPELEKVSNIKMMGNQPLASLPGFMKGFDVCLIPYRMNDFVRNISPTKLYEYLATGKPVVAPDIPALAGLEDIVYVGHDQDEMVKMVGEALGDTSQESADRRVEAARRNTWQQRVDAISGKYLEFTGGAP